MLVFWRNAVPLKSWYPLTRLHSVTIQKTSISEDFQCLHLASILLRIIQLLCWSVICHGSCIDYSCMQPCLFDSWVQGVGKTWFIIKFSSSCALALLVAEAQTLTNSMENAIFWNVMQCGSCMNRRFRGMYPLHLQGRKSTSKEPAWTGGCRLSHQLKNTQLYKNRKGWRVGYMGNQWRGEGKDLWRWASR
jgi:hypothetical protein